MTALNYLLFYTTPLGSVVAGRHSRYGAASCWGCWPSFLCEFPGWGSCLGGGQRCHRDLRPLTRPGEGRQDPPTPHPQSAGLAPLCFQEPEELCSLSAQLAFGDVEGRWSAGGYASHSERLALAFPREPQSFGRVSWGDCRVSGSRRGQNSLNTRCKCSAVDSEPKEVCEAKGEGSSGSAVVGILWGVFEQMMGC